VLVVLRVVGDTNDWVAHRLILGMRPGVTCNTIRQTVIANQSNYRDLFYQAAIAGCAATALNHTRAAIGVIAGWVRGDTRTQTEQRHPADLVQALS